MSGPEATGEVPEALGPWRVLRPLGRGGMGAVFLGERADGRWQQQVAIKLVGHTRPSPELAARFRAERRILGRLRHPGIARLLDGGETSDGTPYLVMEYVDGEPVDRWCDARRLPIEARLQLFLKICDAVQHAHQALVIHRDLKPSNILVTEEGEPRLLDFGIAKVLATDEDGPAEDTRSGLRIMTPRTASPEQILGDPLTTATDTYGLGLLLHVLLAGDLPYPVDGIGIAEFYRTVLEVEPERPSATVLRVGDAVAEARDTTVTRLRGQLRGDLDRIVGKALRKEPQLRYPTVGALAEDVRAHLELRPVSARRDSWRYRSGRFLRRNRAAVGAAAAVLFALGAFATYHTNRIAAERDVAERERATAERVTEFLVDSFDVADPDSRPGETVTAREILDQGAARIRGSLAEAPEIRLRLLETLARVYLSLGLFDQAGTLLDDAIALAEAGGAPPNQRLGLRARKANAVGYGGDLAGGIEGYRAVLADGDSGTLDERLLLRLRSDLADLLQRHGQYAEGLAEIDVAVARARALGEYAEAELADALTIRGGIRVTDGGFDEGEADLREALGLQRRIYGEDNHRIAETLHELGGIAFMRGDYAQSAALLEDVIERQRRTLGPEHAAVGRSMASLASVLWAMNDLPRAEALARESNRIKALTLPPTHDDIVHTLYTLGGIVAQQHRYAEAVELLEETLALQRAGNDPQDPQIGNTLAELAGARLALADFDGAEAAYRESIALQSAALGEDHLWVAITWRQLGMLEFLRGDGEAAVAATAEALDRASRSTPERHPQRAAMHRDHGRALALVGRLEEAERHARRGVELYTAAEHADGMTTSGLALAEVLHRAGRLDEALELAGKALASQEAAYGPDDPQLSPGLVIQARLLAAAGRREASRTVARRAQALRRGLHPPEFPLDRELAALAGAAAAPTSGAP
ncbi:MAG: serine/threonine-protein kinase [Pseudomonadales bacterium]|nr:serine/threonine-protein kinase [Pseudomonadales bacterium]